MPSKSLLTERILKLILWLPKVVSAAEFPYSGSLKKSLASPRPPILNHCKSIFKLISETAEQSHHERYGEIYCESVIYRQNVHNITTYTAHNRERGICSCCSSRRNRCKSAEYFDKKRCREQCH